jgi:hypothetical protein
MIPASNLFAQFADDDGALGAGVLRNLSRRGAASMIGVNVCAKRGNQLAPAG